MTFPTVDESRLSNPGTLQGPHLRLEPLGLQHIDDVLAGLQDEETLRLTGTTGSFSRESVALHLGGVGPRTDRADWAIIESASDRYVGEVVLNELDTENASMNFRIALGTGWRGRGYGTEATVLALDHAFATLQLHRVYLDVYSFNPRAERSYEKSGFRAEGRQRHTLFWDGQWIDSILMSVLSSDPRPTLVK
jgi:RimJ/RimL family protein N-acetyltransferase